jgi:hypothetical protein
VALVAIAVLVCVVVGVKWYMKATVPDPDLRYDLKPWKEWRIRESSEKPDQELSSEHPDVNEGLVFDTNLSDKDSNMPRGELKVFIGSEGSVGGSWYGMYWKTRTRNFQVMNGGFRGKVFPRKIYRSESGEEDPTKLYLMAKGEFLAQETDSDKNRVYNRGGDIYVRGWLTREHYLFGEVTITSDEKYFETFTWKTYRPVRSGLTPFFNIQ